MLICRLAVYAAEDGTAMRGRRCDGPTVSRPKVSRCRFTPILIALLGAPRYGVPHCSDRRRCTIAEVCTSPVGATISSPLRLPNDAVSGDARRSSSLSTCSVAALPGNPRPFALACGVRKNALGGGDPDPKFFICDVVGPNAILLAGGGEPNVLPPPPTPPVAAPPSDAPCSPAATLV